MNEIKINQFYGTLIEAPEFKTTPKGTPLLILNLAYETWSSATREGDKLSFLKVNLWKQAALDYREILKAGDKLIASGEIIQKRWKNKQDNSRSEFLLVAETLQLCDTSDLSPATLEDY